MTKQTQRGEKLTRFPPIYGKPELLEKLLKGSKKRNQSFSLYVVNVLSK